MKALKAAAPVHVEGVRTHFFDLLSAAQVRQLATVFERVAAELAVDDDGDGAEAGAGD
jgi:hypothetical protein